MDLYKQAALASHDAMRTSHVCDSKFERAFLIQVTDAGCPEDPVVGDPVRQDNDKISTLRSLVPSLCVFDWECPCLDGPIRTNRVADSSRRFVYFLPSLRGQTAKTLICTKSGVSADSRKSAKKCRKARKTALFVQKVRKKCAKSAVFRAFRHFLALFLESAETPLFLQINVFAVWPLRLGRKYTIAESRASPDSRESLQGSRTAIMNPFFANRASGGHRLRIAGLRRFARIARTL